MIDVYQNYKLIIIMCIVSLFIITFMYIKLKSRFWSNMPMFFKTRPYYWITCPKLLHQKDNLPIIDKFLNKYDVNCSTFYPFEMSDNEKFILLQFIKNNYIHNKSFTMDISLHKNINLFFSQYYSTESACFIGKFQRNQFPRNKYEINSLYKKIYGMILAKPLTVKTQKKVLRTNYFSFLSKLRSQKIVNGRNITTDLMYNTGKEVLSDMKIPSGIFKSYKQIHNVYPFVTYYEYLFNVENITNKPYDKFFKLTKINDSNFNILRQLIEDNYNDKFENGILCDTLNLYEMVKNNNIHIFITSFNKTISSVYIYKDFGILYKNKKVLDLIGSVFLIDDDLQRQLFTNNLCNSIDYLKKNTKIGYVNIHNCGHNNMVLQYMHSKFREETKFKTYWYLINYILKPIETNKTIIIY